MDVAVLGGLIGILIILTIETRVQVATLKAKLDVVLTILKNNPLRKGRDDNG